MSARILVVLGLLAPATAEASLCVLEPVTPTVPVNCPLVLANQAGSAINEIAVERDGQPVQIEPVVTKSTSVYLDVDYSDDCGGEAFAHETRSEPYDLLELELPGVEVGDLLQISGYGRTAQIVAEVPAEQCPTQPSWAPWCAGSGAIDCDSVADPDDGGGGCSASGDTTAPWLLLALALGVTRRRRRRR
jgi:uncharacterized protein (TIGR03382 family)